MAEVHRPEFGYPVEKSLAREQAKMLLESQRISVDYESRNDPEFMQMRRKLETEQGIVLYDFKDAVDLAVLHSIVNRDDAAIFTPPNAPPGEKKPSERSIMNRFDNNIIEGHLGVVNPSDARILGAIMRRLRPQDMVYVISSIRKGQNIKVSEKYSYASEWQDNKPASDAERGRMTQKRLAQMFET
ncbi:MAG: hypothetical protein HYV13_00925 [Candidatus Doudnabacteria bacterium]|nr:hypothetical protein [Candidatus Doudnabacteria bacterium]